VVHPHCFSRRIGCPVEILSIHCITFVHPFCCAYCRFNPMPSHFHYCSRQKLSPLLNNQWSYCHQGALTTRLQKLSHDFISHRIQLYFRVLTPLLVHQRARLTSYKKRRRLGPSPPYPKPPLSPFILTQNITSTTAESLPPSWLPVHGGRLTIPRSRSLCTQLTTFPIAN
jgi:hypothetical protein